MTRKHGELRADIWRTMVRRDGLHTPTEMAEKFNVELEDANKLLRRMASRQEAVRVPVPAHPYRSFYKVDGTCRVPFGIRVAETQA
jgi:hypothetical protein